MSCKMEQDEQQDDSSSLLLLRDLIPKELLTVALGFLDLVDLASACLVCQAWHTTCMSSDCLWQAFCERKYGAAVATEAAVVLSEYQGDWRAMLQDDAKRVALPTIRWKSKKVAQWQSSSQSLSGSCWIKCLKWDRDSGSIRIYLEFCNNNDPSSSSGTDENNRLFFSDEDPSRMCRLMVENRSEEGGFTMTRYEGIWVEEEEDNDDPTTTTAENNDRHGLHVLCYKGYLEVSDAAFSGFYKRDSHVSWLLLTHWNSGDAETLMTINAADLLHNTAAPRRRTCSKCSRYGRTCYHYVFDMPTTTTGDHHDDSHHNDDDDNDENRLIREYTMIESSPRTAAAEEDLVQQTEEQQRRQRWLQVYVDEAADHEASRLWWRRGFS